MLVLSPNAVRFFSPLGAILPNEPVAAFVTVVRIILPFVAPLDSPPKCKRSPLREEGIPDLLVSRDRDVVGCPHRDWRWTQEEEQWKEGKSASCNFGIHLQSVVIHSPSGLVEPFFRIEQVESGYSDYEAAEEESKGVLNSSKDAAKKE
jgi:hypothetical protein